jgi:hypothetical protein
MADLKETKVITGKVRFSYVHVFKPEAVGESEEKKYSVSLIIPKSDKKTLKAIKQAIDAAKENGKSSKFGGKIPANLKTPLRDGDEDRPEDEAYANAYFINASAYSRPGIVDKNREPITEEEEFYSGCYGRASITFFPFNASGNKGIAAGLNHVQKTSEGEPLGGRVSVDVDFADDPDFDDDEDDDDDFLD